MKMNCRMLSLISLFLFATFPLFANDLTADGTISAYKPNYIIMTWPPEPLKLQVSMKYDFFFPWKVGLYAGYSQLMIWDIFASSSPFREMEYNPEIFWRFESKNNFLDDVDLPGVDYLQLGFFEHRSNGEEGTNSRSYNRSYIEAQLSVGDLINFGVNGKYFYMYTLFENPDIQDYMGSFEAKLFLKVRGIEDGKRVDYEEYYIAFGTGGGKNGLDFSKGWQEAGVKIRSFFSRVRPYVQLYNGYNETLLHYNRKSEFVVRAGLIFE